MLAPLLVVALSALGSSTSVRTSSVLAARQQVQAPPIAYRITFPEPEHHWMQVEMTVKGLGQQPLQARMSRSSPGRYAVHEFAKNVFSFEAFDSKGTKLAFSRPNVDEWDVAGHDGTVRAVYKIFGDHADGTYLGVDTTHAHLNMPAAFMWAVGHDMDPVQFTFVPPAALNWKIATQLFPTSDPWTFTSPNLQYYMDSPTELSDFLMGRFSVPNADGTPANFRVMVHGGDSTQAEVDELSLMIQRLVREEEAVYGEFPKYEPGYYTFLLDYVPWGFGDGMEHRNSTSISEPGLTIHTREDRVAALSTISHEFFHNWNVERIRPEGLEPFDFTRENITCCLWLAEGFTQYYQPLFLTRMGVGGPGAPGVNNVAAVINGSGREVRSAVQMSQYGPFNDAAQSIDMRDANRTFISYYTDGAAIAFGLDLTLRERSGGKTSLDDYMRLLWTRFGKPGGPAAGLVGRAVFAERHPRRARRPHGRPHVCQRLLRPVHRGSRGRRLREAPRAGRLHPPPGAARRRLARQRRPPGGPGRPDGRQRRRPWRARRRARVARAVQHAALRGRRGRRRRHRDDRRPTGDDGRLERDLTEKAGRQGDARCGSP